MLHTLQNRYVISYISIYIITLIMLSVFENYEATESIAIAIIFGIIFPLIAYLSTKKSNPLIDYKPPLNGELKAIIISITLVIIFLTIGLTNIKSFLGLSTDSLIAKDIISLIAKLTFFVFIPYLIFAKKFNFKLSDFGFQPNFKVWREKNHIKVLIILSSLFILFQYFVGQAASPIRNGEFTSIELLKGLPLTFAWLLLEVGLVEEFFFRAFLQSRISAYLKSDSAGIIISALLFGLAHAPGLILRGAGEMSSLGTDPSALLAIGHSIVVLSAAGLFLGIVWAKTKNLLLVMMIHASGDLLTNYSGFMATWF